VPLYEYQCGHCGRFEVIQKFSDPILSACPTCGREVTKLLSAPAIQFKGSGWYVTDYAKKSGGEGASKAEPSSATSKDASSADKAGSKESGSSQPASSKGGSTASGSGSSK
jgi:putative FmdB family regulatory protein